MIEARLKGVVPYGCMDYQFRAAEEYRPMEDDALMGFGPRSMSSFDDRLYHMMKHDPSSVASLVRRLSGRW